VAGAVDFEQPNKPARKTVTAVIKLFKTMAF